MSYIINKTDGTVLTTILDGTVDNTTSLTLVGKKREQFGEIINEDLIRLLESGANTTPPNTPLVGQLWFDKSTNTLKVYTGAAFKPISSSFASNTQPATSNVGDLWLDTANRQLKIYTDIGYTLVGPTYTASQGITGIFAGNITDVYNAQHVAANIYVGGTLLGVISKDSSYLPLTTISGISTVEPGLTFTANIVSPTLTGTPLAPTADAGTTTTQVATTEFVTDAVDTAITNLTSTTDGALALKANIASPVFTGNPQAPTPADGDNDTSIATTKFVGNAITIAVDTLSGSTSGSLALKANIASPTLTGTPRAPTATSGTNSTQIATTEFVTTAINNIPADSELWKGSNKFVSTSAPTSGDGEDGDIWIQV
jgi:hypothetical protein